MNVLIFLLKAITCSGILYGYYYLSLRNKKFHQYNRFYLLISVIASIVLPLINIPVYVSASEPQAAYLLNASELTIVDIDAANDRFQQLMNWQNFALTAYVLGCLFFLAILTRSLYYLVKISRKYPSVQTGELILYQTGEPNAPFSFLNRIFWSNSMDMKSAEGQQIFRHEMYHVRQKHSIDILLMEVVIIICWLNPFYHIIKREIQAIHEFLADEYAISGNDKHAYAELLILQTISNKKLSITNPFFNHQIRRRITMITNINKSKFAYLRRITALPLFVFIFCAFTFKISSWREEGNKPVTKQTAVLFLKDTLPALQKKTVPRAGDSVKLTLNLPQNGTGKFAADTPLLVVDDVEHDYSHLASINPADIESVSVLKDAHATEAYGKKGAHGVVIVTTKKSTPTVSSQRSPVGDTVKMSVKEAGNIFSNVKDLSIKSTGELLYVTADKNKVYVFQKKEVDEYLQNQKPKADYDKIFTKTEIEAMYPGGQSAWVKYLNKNISYPPAAQAGKIQGAVVIQFIVETDGKVSDIQVISGAQELREEAKRVIRESGDWLPAIQNGRKVRAYKKQAITFKLQQ